VVVPRFGDPEGTVCWVPSKAAFPGLRAGATSYTENEQNGGKRMLLTEVWSMDTKSVYPTVNEINALPSKVKRYIHDLEMRINQNGQALTVMQLREERDLLQQRVEELEARIALQEREYLEVPIETD
jgi:hypothetical protein